MSYTFKKRFIFASLALFASHLTASLGIPGSTLDVIQMSGYPYALGAGALIAYAILFTISWITEFLNKKLPWRENLGSRILSQLFLGLVCPFCMIVLFITAYFWLAGFHIRNTGWFEYCAAAIVTMLVFVNLIYGIFIDLVDTGMIAASVEEEQQKNMLIPVPLFMGRSYLELTYIGSVGKKNIAMFENGLELRHPQSISFAFKNLTEASHLRANKGQIIRITSIVNAYWYDEKRLRIKAYLKGNDQIEIIFSENQTIRHKDLLRTFFCRADHKLINAIL